MARVKLVREILPGLIQHVAFGSEVITPGRSFKRSGVFPLLPRARQNESQLVFDMITSRGETEFARLRVEGGKLFSGGEVGQFARKLLRCLLHSAISIRVSF